MIIRLPNSHRHFLFLILVFTSLGATAQGTASVQTDWLKPEAGSSGEAINAEVTAIQPNASGGARIDLTIPLEEIKRFDQVEVISKETRESIPLTKPPIWIDEHEKDVHGLKLFLKRYPRYEFRLRFTDSELNLD